MTPSGSASPEALPRRALVRGIILAAILIASLGIFLWLLQELTRGTTRAFDRTALEWVAAYRTSTLTGIAVDLTALGSRTLLTVANLLVFALLWTGGRRLAAVDTALASTVAAIVTRMTKAVLGAERPPLADRLVEAAGFSFPSGHASGIAALLAATGLHTIEAARSRAQRVVLGVMHAILLIGVGWSRIYLGVHYPTDVVAGIAVGIACALAAHGLLRTRGIARHLRALLR